MRRRVLQYETERLLGETLAHMATGWAVSQDKVYGLLLAIKSDLRLGVKEQELPRHGLAAEVKDQVSSILTDEDISRFERIIKECKGSSKDFTKSCGDALEELLDHIQSNS